jgi:hypothetical protein
VAVRPFLFHQAREGEGEGKEEVSVVIESKSSLK